MQDNDDDGYQWFVFFFFLAMRTALKESVVLSGNMHCAHTQNIIGNKFIFIASLFSNTMKFMEISDDFGSIRQAISECLTNLNLNVKKIRLFVEYVMIISNLKFHWNQFRNVF